jgi:CSLREA domain-containing protein
MDQLFIRPSRTYPAVRWLALIVFLVLFSGALLFEGQLGQREAVWVVNTAADTPDAVPGDGICADASGMCSLRAAMHESEDRTGHILITVPLGTYTLTEPLEIRDYCKVRAQ